MTAPVVVAGLVGYLAGSVSTAVLVARTRGVDLRSVGSGNPGASNAGRALGRRTGLAIGLVDALKGLLPAAGFGQLDHRAGLVAGSAAVLGHVTSPWLHGRGGKGVATAFGAVLGSHPLWAPVALLVWLAGLAGTRWIALASVAAALSLPVTAVLATADVQDRLWAALIALVVVVRHRGNLAGRPRRPQSTGRGPRRPHRRPRS